MLNFLCIMYSVKAQFICQDFIIHLHLLGKNEKAYFIQQEKGYYSPFGHARNHHMGLGAKNLSSMCESASIIRYTESIVASLVSCKISIF